MKSIINKLPVLLILIGIAVLTNHLIAQDKNKTAEQTEETASTDSTESAGESEWPEQAPDVFKIKVECSNGIFVVECHKEWAPVGVERFYELVRGGIYDEARFFRVLKTPRPFMAQIGIPADPKVAAKWKTMRIQDDPVKQSNKLGMVTFATSGKDSRTTQFFINFSDNSFLDGQGFSPFGKVVEGMDVVMKINGEYGDRPDQGLIQSRGNAYLNKNFPRLDYIKKTTLVQ